MPTTASALPRCRMDVQVSMGYQADARQGKWHPSRNQTRIHRAHALASHLHCASHGNGRAPPPPRCVVQCRCTAPRTTPHTTPRLDIRMRACTVSNRSTATIRAAALPAAQRGCQAAPRHVSARVRFRSHSAQQRLPVTTTTTCTVPVTCPAKQPAHHLVAAVARLGAAATASQGAFRPPRAHPPSCGRRCTQRLQSLRRAHTGTIDGRPASSSGTGAPCCVREAGQAAPQPKPHALA